MLDVWSDWLSVKGEERVNVYPLSQRIISVTLGARLMQGFDHPNQPAIVLGFEASALAALFGLKLPTGIQWEIAAGNLRDKKYRKEKELKAVAHFHAEATADVRSKAPNQSGLYDNTLHSS